MATKNKTSSTAKKNSAKAPVKKAAAKKASAVKVLAKNPAKKSVSRNGASSGVYTSPNGNVSIGVPAFWTLRQTNDDLEVEAPSGHTSVIVTAFQRQPDYEKLDAREYMQHFLETANSNGRPRLDSSNKQRASSRFRDVDGDNWEVIFLTNGNTLLLATCNSSEPRTGKEAKAGLGVLNSLKLKGK